jgi:hypothetical protein
MRECKGGGKLCTDVRAEIGSYTRSRSNALSSTHSNKTACTVKCLSENICINEYFDGSVGRLEDISCHWGQSRGGCTLSGTPPGRAEL